MKPMYNIYFQSGTEAGLEPILYFDNREAAEQVLAKLKIDQPDEEFLILEDKLYTSADEVGERK